jgi:hypothetical protein
MAINIGRRKFIVGLGGTAVWPLAARAAGGRPRIGFLDINSAASNTLHLAAFSDVCGISAMSRAEPWTSITAMPTVTLKS